MKMILGFLISMIAFQAHAVSLHCSSDKKIKIEGGERVNEIIVYHIESLDPSLISSSLSVTVDVFPDTGSGRMEVRFGNQCDNEYGLSFETAAIQQLISGQKSQINGNVDFNWIGKVGGKENANLTCRLISDRRAAKELGIRD